jgi:2-polyprenyl-3-methyl-5-hydroxy-6-metoxy-1,4-benzoquinol methylase
MTRSEVVPGARYHEDLASRWTDAYKTGSFGRRLRFLEPFLDRVVRPGNRWLDAGCGSGVLSRCLVARGATVIAMDASPAMIARAREAESRGIEYRLVASIETLDVPESSLDGVLCSSVLEYVADPTAAVREFHRVLRPGGTLILTVPNRLSAIRMAQHAARTAAGLVGKPLFDYLGVSSHSFSRRSSEDLLHGAGFVVDDVAGFSPYWPRLLVPAGLGALWMLAGHRAAA